MRQDLTVGDPSVDSSAPHTPEDGRHNVRADGVAFSGLAGLSQCSRLFLDETQKSGLTARRTAWPSSSHSLCREVRLRSVVFLTLGQTPSSVPCGRDGVAANVPTWGRAGTCSAGQTDGSPPPAEVSDLTRRGGGHPEGQVTGLGPGTRGEER